MNNSLKGIKYAIFDMDGTLIESMGAWAEYRYNLIVNAIGYYDEDINVGVLTTAEVRKIMLEKHGVEITEQDMMDVANIYLKNFYEQKVELKSGVKEALEKFHGNGVKMCIATANRREWMGNVLDRLGISQYMQMIITCYDVGKGKTNPLVYEKAMEQLGGNKDNTWVFEDAVTAGRTCKEAGFKLCAVSDISNKVFEDELKELADVFINSFSELL